MRTFTLFDINGTEYNITTKDNAFFHSVDGLGFEREMTFQQVDERFKKIDDLTVQKTIQGTVFFGGMNPESHYFAFAKFCKNAPLRMKYNPGHGEYYRMGYVKALGRGDGSGTSKSASVEFVCTTPWYKVVQKYNDGTASDGKVYDYAYDYNYTESTPGSVAYESDSFEDCPAKLIIHGAVSNPVWRHYVDGVLVATGKINGSIASGRRLVVDTTVIPWSIKQFDTLGNLVSDMYQLSDFSTERFIRLSHGKNVISVTDDGVDPVTVTLEAQIEYDTV